MAILKVSLPLPCSVNHLYAPGRGNRRYKTAAAHAWHTNASLILRGAAIQQGFIIMGGWAWSAVCWFPDNHRRDMDNYAKQLNDAMCDAFGVDDRWQQLREIHMRAGGIDREDPRMDLEISNAV